MESDLQGTLCRAAVAWLFTEQPRTGMDGSLDPFLACRVLTHFGTPIGQVQLLRQVWTQQLRHMQYLSQTAPQPDLARASLPHGDSWAMLAMTAVLLPAAYALQRQFPTCARVLYADDRSFACPTARQARQCQTQLVCAPWAC